MTLSDKGSIPYIFLNAWLDLAGLIGPIEIPYLELHVTLRVATPDVASVLCERLEQVVVERQEYEQQTTRTQ